METQKIQFIQINKMYKFRLIQSFTPIIERNVIIKDSNVGGVKNTYKIYLIHQVQIKNIGSFILPFWKKYLGVKGFLRPYKKSWNKYVNRLPKNYWGDIKSPLLNMWVVLAQDYHTLGNRYKITSQTTQSYTVEVLGIIFKSTTLSKLLKLNRTFIINQKN
jgi:hypothetical protein